MFPDPPDGFVWRVLADPRDRIEALVSTRFPILHGFTCRVRNRRPGAPALGVRNELDADLDLLGRVTGVLALHSMRQVHGAAVRVVSGDSGAWTPPESDALVARTPGLAVAVKAADCVPVLLADPLSGAVAGAHAGWRGAVAGVAEAAARTLAREADAPPSRLAAVIGPAIGACCFEVGPEVVTAFADAGLDPTRFTNNPLPGARPRLDLREANRRQLLDAGLDPARIHDAALCTRCHPAFHSYRREGPGVGRNWAFAVAARSQADTPTRPGAGADRRPASPHRTRNAVGKSGPAGTPSKALVARP